MQTKIRKRRTSTIGASMEMTGFSSGVRCCAASTTFCMVEKAALNAAPGPIMEDGPMTASTTTDASFDVATW